LAQGKENYTLKGEEFIHFLFTKSETLDSCRFDIKCFRMHQILFQFTFFGGNTPGPPPLGALPQTSGEGREGMEGKEEGRERGRKGRKKFASLPLGG